MLYYKLQNLIDRWKTNKDYSLINEIIKTTGKNFFYKLCKSEYILTNDKFYIRSIRKINLYYRIKAYFLYKSFKKDGKKDLILYDKKTYAINQLIDNITENSDKFVYIMQVSFFDEQGINYYSGGGERYACDLANLIRAKGYKPILIQKGADTAKEPWHINFNGLDVIGINADIKSYYKIINELKPSKLTIYSGVYNWDTEKSHHPSILISHGLIWDNPYQNANILELINILNVADLMVSVDTNTISWFRATYSHYIANSNIKMKYIPNYTDLTTYKPKERQTDKIKITYPRRCIELRGFWLIANIIPKLLEEFKDIEFELVGYAHTPEIENKIASLKSMYPERFSHYVCDADEMVKVYQNTDISVIPTLYSEGTSLSCIEAMACGNAIVATNVGGLSNLIINNFNGILTEPYEEEIYSSLKQLIMDKELRDKISKNAVQTAKAFSKEEWERNWNLLLDKFLQINYEKDSLENLHENYYEKNYLNTILASLETSKKSRLFITTGFISTINAMGIIDNLDNFQYDNILIIYSSKTSDIFKQYNLKLILDGYFKKIFFADDFSYDENIKYIENQEFLNKFDEIYTTVQPTYQIYNMHSNINLLEEGISSYYPYDFVDYKNVNKIYLYNYFNKVQYFDNKNLSKTETIGKNSIKKIIKKVREQNNIDFSYLKKENQILILSQYIYNNFLPLEKVVKFYQKHIDKLIKKGYNVLFKSHPRVNDTVLPKLIAHYKNESRFNVIPVDVKYPIELIVEQIDPVAIATSVSGGAFCCGHLFDIKCYGFGAKLAKQHSYDNIKRNANLFLEYLPHISELNKIN